MIRLSYIAAIVAANVVTAATVPTDVLGLLIPAGTWFVAVTFVLRDAIHVRHGVRAAYVCIGVALAASAAASAVLHDTLAIAVGSAAAFAVSETVDTETFRRLRRGLPARVAASGVAGSIVDSAVFAVVALSPLWSGILPWAALPAAIAGQLAVKAAMQIAAGAAVAAARVRAEAAT